MGGIFLLVFSIYPNKLSHTVDNRFRSIGRAMVASIIFLYIATTVNVFINWEFHYNAIVEDGIFFLVSGTGKIVIFKDPLMQTESKVPGIGITAVMSTVIADSIMVCAILVANLNINSVLYKLDLALLDGLGTTLARSSVSYPLSYLWTW